MSESSHRYVEVAAGVCLRADGSFLLAQRPQGKPYAGYWEFPGGKVEPGESPATALVRELGEELAIEPAVFHPWITRTHHYEHASVRLRFFRIRSWRGEFECREFQQIAWQSPGAESVAPMLPANGPILRALELPAVLGISQATELGSREYRDRLQLALSCGLRMVMLREKTWPRERFVAFARDVAGLCREHDALCILNTSADVAEEVQSDGLHLTSQRLSACKGRPDVKWCGASCHNARELEQAAKLAVDYVVLGPVMPTRSHPGAEVLGWRGFRALIQDFPIPVYALGGLSSGDLEVAWDHGAHGIAMMRGAWMAQSAEGGALPGSGSSSSGTR